MPAWKAGSWGASWGASWNGSIFVPPPPASALIGTVRIFAELDGVSSTGHSLDGVSSIRPALVADHAIHTALIATVNIR